MATMKAFDPHLQSKGSEEYGQESKIPLLISIQPSKPSGFRRFKTIILLSLFSGLGFIALIRTVWLNRRAPSTSDYSTSGYSTTTVPDYFQTTPELFPGPTATGTMPFLAETNPAVVVPNTPLQTGQLISGASKHNIFELMGNLSPYFPNPSGFGVDEYPLPQGARISQLHFLHRHGSRYPTADASVAKFGRTLSSIVEGGKTNFTGNLSFLNSWSYGLGQEILVPVGRQQLFDSGVLHYYNYAHLYNTSTNIIARTTSQDRMLKSAEYFMAGFFGQEWIQNATLEVIIDLVGFNNSLAGRRKCSNTNSPTKVALGGTNASEVWQNIYLRDAQKRLQSWSGDSFSWKISDVYDAQNLCPYETVAYGYSAWCQLFNYTEWEGYEYSIDLEFAGDHLFQSPTGRAVGIGYVEELLARLNSHLLTSSTAQDNITLDNNPTTFPLNQTLYFDFSHETNIVHILTAFGMTQFAKMLSPQGPPDPDRALKMSHIQPFAGRLDIEIISAPHPVSSSRDGSREDKSEYEEGGPTKYIHFIINQRTLPLGKSFAECGNREDGWCELIAFMETQKGNLAKARYEYSCFANYPSEEYGKITDGAPIS